jgi:hypothetical protein
MVERKYRRTVQLWRILRKANYLYGRVVSFSLASKHFNSYFTPSSAPVARRFEQHTQLKWAQGLRKEGVMTEEIRLKEEVHG